MPAPLQPGPVGASKRKHAGDDPDTRRPTKAPRRSMSPQPRRQEVQSSGGPPLLSDEESNLLQQTFHEVMASSVGSIGPPRSLKRTSSQQSLATDVTGKSIISNSQYRSKILRAAEVYLPCFPPDSVQESISNIFKPAVSEERRSLLRTVSQRFRTQCIKSVQDQAVESSFLELIHDAIKMIRSENVEIYPNSEWREELKPIPMPPKSITVGEVEGATMRDRPLDNVAQSISSKRQHLTTQQPQQPQSGDEADSVHRSGPGQVSIESPTMEPPQFPWARSPIKTPRPDLSIGIRMSSILSALTSLSIRGFRPKKMFDALEETTVYRKPDWLPQPALLARPVVNGPGLAFPFLVVEAKAYSTGKQIFEAENQAAVAGASALQLQLCLNDLVDQAEAESNSEDLVPRKGVPLAFSITTQGPIHELWAHYMDSDEGVRTFNSTLLHSMNAILPTTVESFMVAVHHVCYWGTGPYLESITARLGYVAKYEARKGEAGMGPP